MCLFVGFDFGFATHQVFVDERKSVVDKFGGDHSLLVFVFQSSLIVETHEGGEEIASALHVAIHHIDIDEVGFLCFLVHRHIFLEGECCGNYACHRCCDGVFVVGGEIFCGFHHK